jgi:hypothetical protein
MPEQTIIIAGLVKNGVVVPEGSATLPEGAHVSIVITPSEIPADLREEFAAWERASDEAWAMIDDWEKEEPK